jgi:DNA-binding transcriptional MocR family regulator
MVEARRREIAGIAESCGLPIIEDDVFGFLPRQRPKPIAAFAPEHTIFVTSVSKCMAPGLRIGYVHAPERLRPSLQAAVSMSSWMPPPLMAEIATRWIEDGTAARLNEAQRKNAESRQGMARSILAGHDFQADPSGFHLWLKLPESWRPDSFLASARRRGVELRTSETFLAGRQKARGSIRLCLGHEISNERVAKGLRTVADLLKQGGDDSVLFL